MGVLKQQGTDTLFEMPRRCAIGREKGCWVLVGGTDVSSRHAEVVWHLSASCRCRSRIAGLRGHWALHDTGSKNGTHVEGRRLQQGEYVPVLEGSSFKLGASLTFTVVDESPPRTMARSTRTGAVRFAQGGILALPDDDHPEVSIVEDRAGGWAAEGEDTSRPVEDGEEIIAGGERWKLALSTSIDATSATTQAAEVLLETIALRIVVSRNGEDHDLVVSRAGREITLKSKAPFYVLLTLARARLDDADASPGERGWIDRDELCRMLGRRTDPGRLAVDVHRVRKTFTDLKIQGAANIIERRPGSGQLRLGIDKVEIVQL